MNLNGIALMNTYLLLAAINVWAAGNSKKYLFALTKSLLMPVLLGIYLAFSPGDVQKALILALLFAWAGDVLLLMTSDNKKIFPGQRFTNGKYALMAGGLAFMMCHCCYLWTFIHMGFANQQWQLYLMLAYFLFGCWFYIDYVGDFYALEDYLKIGIAFYTLIILLMSCCSILIIREHQFYSWLPFTGTLLFICSDYLLAVGYKKGKSSIYQAWVMAFYLTAQFLIIFPLTRLT